MKIKDYLKIENATDLSRTEVGRLGTAIIFVVGVMIFTGSKFADVEQSYLLVAAAVIGAYMAINIGANDVANNVGPAVGSFALSLTGAIIIAAVFEAAGAIIPPSASRRRWSRRSSRAVTWSAPSRRASLIPLMCPIRRYLYGS